MKQIKLPEKLRNEMIDFASSTVITINHYFADACTIAISDSYTDTKIIKIFEQLGFWLKIIELQPEKKAYDRISNDLMDFMLLEELNKGIERRQNNG